MSVRTPSLRQLQTNRPANVAILPSASPRKIEQKCNKAMRAAATTLRDKHASRFGYRHPHVRNQIETAEALLELDKTPALEILVAMLSIMDRTEAEKIALKLLANSGSKSAQQALAIVRSRLMNVGEMGALFAAMDEVKKERGL